MKWAVLLPLSSLLLAGDQPGGLPPCWDEGRFIESLPYRDCVALGRPERIRGIWVVGLEESGFLPEGSPEPAIRVLSGDEGPAEADTFLDVGRGQSQSILADVPEPEGVGDAARYHVEFVGRRARHPGDYGYDGSRNLIVVDRMITIRPSSRVRTRVRLGGLDCWIEDCAGMQAEMREREER